MDHVCLVDMGENVNHLWEDKFSWMLKCLYTQFKKSLCTTDAYLSNIVKEALVKARAQNPAELTAQRPLLFHLRFSLLQQKTGKLPQSC